MTGHVTLQVTAPVSYSIPTHFQFVNEKIVSFNLLNQLQSYHINKTDLLFGDIVAKGHGFFYLPLDRAGVSYFH